MKRRGLIWVIHPIEYWVALGKRKGLKIRRAYMGPVLYTPIIVFCSEGIVGGPKPASSKCDKCAPPFRALFRLAEPARCAERLAGADIQAVCEQAAIQRVRSFIAAHGDGMRVEAEAQSIAVEPQIPRNALQEIVRAKRLQRPQAIPTSAGEDVMELTRDLSERAEKAGASLWGVASVERFHGAPKGHHPCELLPGAMTVFTFGIRLLDRVLEWPELLQGSPLFPEEMRVEALHALLYRRSGYDIVNDRLNDIALLLANHLEDHGYPSLFFPATYGALPDRVAQFPGMLSQRHAAVRAGLGEFGLNNVVVTRRYGPRIRFNSVITAAPLTPSPLLRAKTCPGTTCQICLEECPADALSLLPDAAEDRVWLDPVSRTDWTACRQKREPLACAGRCLRVCPVGQGQRKE